MKLACVLFSFVIILSESAFGGVLDRVPVLAASPQGQFTVGIVIHKASGKQSVCTGVLVDDHRVLTAAHCVDHGHALEVVFSRGDILKDQTAARYPVITQTIIPGYPGRDSGLAEFVDLAWIEFNGVVPEGYRFAKFLSHDQSLASLSPDVSYQAVGFAPRFYGSVAMTQAQVSMVKLSSHEVYILVRGQDSGLLCGGDSGGPILQVIQGETYVVGIASRANCINQAVYTRVDQELLLTP